MGKDDFPPAARCVCGGHRSGHGRRAGCCFGVVAYLVGDGGQREAVHFADRASAFSAGAINVYSCVCSQYIAADAPGALAARPGDAGVCPGPGVDGRGRAPWRSGPVDAARMPVFYEEPWRKPAP
jgi:hypothetical protein